ncbi:hypothetical protein Ancab_039383 [Ancistrocladus abbreviatus]
MRYNRLERKGRCKYCANYGIRTPNRGFLLFYGVTKKIHPWSLELGNARAFASEVGKALASAFINACYLYSALPIVINSIFGYLF